MNMKNDENTTVNELKKIVQKFCEDRDWDQFHNPKDLVIGVATEACELLELFLWQPTEEATEILSDKLKNERVREELADVLYFVLRFAQKNGIDLSKILAEKIKKNEEKYPVEKARGSDKKYTEL